MDLQLGGKTALITGGSKGIGLATAQTLAEEGVKLCLVARGEEALLATQARLVAEHDVAVEIMAEDLGQPGAAERVRSRFKQIHILINNAGAIPAGDLIGVDESTWRDAWDLKVFGYINLTRLYYAKMRKTGGGVIVNVIGTGGERHDASYIAGAAGNASLMAFTRALGARGPRDNVRVVGVNPGLTRTERLETQARQRAEMAGRDPAEWQQMLGRLPFNRPADAREVADVIAFLASPRAGYVSGTVVTVDGGHSVSR